MDAADRARARRPLGRLLGYEATYVPAQAEVALEASV
jgi:hypothetical protein